MYNPKNKLSPNDFANKVFKRNQRLGSHACEILAQAVQAVDPYDCVDNIFHYNSQQMTIGSKVIRSDQYERIFLIGFGKASVPMAVALMDKLGEKIIQASVVTKDTRFFAANGYQNKLTVHQGGHPIPTERSLKSTQAVLESLPVLTENDLVLVVISGGGSALFTLPVDRVKLDDLQKLTRILLNSGADINEINTIRKHLDQVKGGRLAEKLQPARVETLILSDVIGDHFDMIASGPTVPDPTTYQDALNIITRYGIENEVPHMIMNSLEKGRDGELPETLKPGQLQPGRVDNHLVGTNFLAAHSAFTKAEALDYHALIVSTALTGQTKHVADFIDGIIHTQMVYDQPASSPACLIFGGETTVNVTGDGLGGRNMDLALRMVTKLAGKKGVLFVSLATDGEDGPTDAAGAVVDGLMFAEAKTSFEMGIKSYIKANDSYHYFEQVGGLIKTGATGTNVNDLVIILFEQ